MRVDDLRALACPDCHAPLAWRGTNLELVIQDGAFTCAACGAAHEARDGWATFYREGRVRQRDRLLCALCDRHPRLHDPAVALLLPIAQGGGDPRQVRREANERLDLGSMAPGTRLLEVGVGAGSHLPALRAAMPAGTEIWGTDLSVGMLRLARRRCARDRRLGATRLLLADAHRLPFAGATFDRVLHVGNAAGFRDPEPALAEMARVTRPGGTVVVVVEHLDPSRRQGLLHRRIFGAIADPHSALQALPENVRDVEVRQVTRFYACVRFRVGG